MATTGAPADRGTQLLDEAIRLAAESGLASVTHRSVQAAAGAPHGSVTYWFGNREGLLRAMVDRLVEMCEARVAPIAEQVAAMYAAGGQPDVDAVAAGVAAWIDQDRELHLARLELAVAAIRDSALRDRMRDAAQVFWRMCEPLAAATGSDDPERDGRAMARWSTGCCSTASRIRRSRASCSSRRSASCRSTARRCCPPRWRGGQPVALMLVTRRGTRNARP